MESVNLIIVYYFNYYIYVNMPDYIQWLRLSGPACVTLISLRRLRDVDGQLAREGVDAHHATVGGARELGVAPRYAIERLCDVGRAL